MAHNLAPLYAVILGLACKGCERRLGVATGDRLTWIKEVAVALWNHRLSRRPLASMALVLIALTAPSLAACAPGAASPTATARASATGAAGGAGSNTITLTAPAAWALSRRAPRLATSVAFATARLGYLCAQNPSDYTKPAPGLYRTTDGGATWAHVVTPNPGMPCQVFLDAHDASDLFIQQVLGSPTGAGDPLKAALWRSRDGGATWSRLALVSHTNGWDTLIVSGARLFALVRPVYYGAAGCPDGSPAPKEFSTPSSLVYTSDDGGQTWSVFGASLVAQNLRVTGLVSDGQAIYVQTRPAATDCSTIWRPITWRRLNLDNTWTTIPTPTAATSILTFWPAASGGMYALDTYQTDHLGPIQVAVSDASGSAWTTLPALTPPAGLTDNGLDEAAVAPSGHVYAQLQTSSGAVSYPGAVIFALDPAAARPTWSVYAVNHASAWAPIESGGALTMWGIYADQQNSAVASLPMP